MLEELAGIISNQLDGALGVLPLYIILKFTVLLTAFVPGISILAMFAIWLERKVSAHMQGRIGPMETGGFHGWLQSLADGLKLLQKEDLMPASADGLLFKFAPYVAFAPVFTAFLALPFGPQFIFESGLNIGVLYVLAMLAIEVMAVIMAGWGSNSKWSIYGAMREACQMVSYEIPLGMSILAGVMVAGTLDLLELSYLQGGGIHKWFIFHNPFVFLAFFVYFVSSLAENKRAPFDLPEAESELVAGFLTEYSGIRWSLFFFAEYSAMFAVGGIQAALFLGGWNSPLGLWDPIYNILGYDPVTAGQGFFAGTITGGAAEQALGMGLANADGTGNILGMILINLYCFAWFSTKAMAIVFVQMWLRWTLPRIRMDQVLYSCVKVLLPASILLFLATMGFVAVFGDAVPENYTGPIRLLHLIQNDNAWIRMPLAFLAVAAFAYFFVWLPIKAFLSRDNHPKQSMFPDIMPVGNTIAFTKHDTPEDEISEGIITES